jgi:hypothetical protein
MAEPIAGSLNVVWEVLVIMDDDPEVLGILPDI